MEGLSCLLDTPNLHSRLQLTVSVILEDNAQIRLIAFASNQLVGVLPIIDREAMSNEPFDVDAPFRYEVEKGFDIAVLSPAHVGKRVIVPPLFVFRVVPTRSIGHRDE